LSLEVEPESIELASSIEDKRVIGSSIDSNNLHIFETMQWTGFIDNV